MVMKVRQWLYPWLIDIATSTQYLFLCAVVERENSACYDFPFGWQCLRILLLSVLCRPWDVSDLAYTFSGLQYMRDQSRGSSMEASMA